MSTPVSIECLGPVGVLRHRQPAAERAVERLSDRLGHSGGVFRGHRHSAVLRRSCHRSAAVQRASRVRAIEGNSISLLRRAPVREDPRPAAGCGAAAGAQRVDRRCRNDGSRHCDELRDADLLAQASGCPVDMADAIGLATIVERLAHNARQRGNAHGDWTASAPLKKRASSVQRLCG